MRSSYKCFGGDIREGRLISARTNNLSLAENKERKKKNILFQKVKECAKLLPLLHEREEEEIMRKGSFV